MQHFKKMMNDMSDISGLMEDYSQDKLDLVSFIKKVEKYYYEFSNAVIKHAVDMAKEQLEEVLQEEISKDIDVPGYTSTKDAHKMEVWIENFFVKEGEYGSYETSMCQDIVSYYYQSNRIGKGKWCDYSGMSAERHEELIEVVTDFIKKIDGFYFSGIKFK